MDYEQVKSYIDILSGTHSVINYDEWKYNFFNKTGQEFGDLKGHVTGENLYRINNYNSLIATDSITYNGWELKLINIVDKFTGEVQHKIKIKGCPAKIYNGHENLFNLTLNDFSNVLNDFSDTFSIPLDEIKIAAPTEVSGTFFLDREINERLVIFQLKKPFEPMYNSDSEIMGYQVLKEINQHFHPKIYLPGIKFRKPLNTIRIERHYDKIATLTRDTTGIYTWVDLLDEKMMFKCYQIVLDTWQDTIVFDPTLKLNVTGDPLLKQIIKHGYTPHFWQEKIKKQLSAKALKKIIYQYNLLSTKYGEGLYENVLKSIKKEGAAWQNVTANCMVTNGIIYKENKGDTGNESNNESVININNSKQCISCNRDISNQRSNSKFCSSKYVGVKDAKRCRNKYSNAKHNAKRKKKVAAAPVLVKEPVSKLRELLKKINENYSKTA